MIWWIGETIIHLMQEGNNNNKMTGIIKVDNHTNNNNSSQQDNNWPNSSTLWNKRSHNFKNK